MRLDELLEVGKTWIERGHYVFPVKVEVGHDELAAAKRDGRPVKANKVPATATGFKQATNDFWVFQRQVRDAERNLSRWLRDHEDHKMRSTATKSVDLGVGLVPGRAGFVVLDPDVLRKEKGGHVAVVDGPGEADRIGANSTWTSETSSGGEHRWFRKPDPEVLYGNRTPWDNIDVRADAGFVIAPGTQTLWGDWVEREPWDESKVRTLPQDLADQLQEAGPASTWSKSSGEPYDPRVHDRDLERVTVASHEVLVEDFGVDPSLTTVVRLQDEDGDERSVLYVVRPGKTESQSASIGFAAPGRLHVWSSNWEGFEQEGQYSYRTLLEMAGRAKPLRHFSGEEILRWGEDAERKRKAEKKTTPPGGRAGRLIVRRASDFKKKRVRWLWGPNRLPVGMLALLGGQPGVGKSQMAVWLTAKVTRGSLPGEYFGKPRNVVVVATEDDWEMVILPRLDAAGADLDRVIHVEARTKDGEHALISLPHDTEALEQVLADEDFGLLVLDPLISRLSGGLDTHKDAEVRQALEPLVAMCQRTRTSILGLIHVNKGSDTAHILDRIMGSKAFTGVARVVQVAVRDRESESQRYLFGVAKNNVGPEDSSTEAYVIEGVTYLDEEDGGLGETSRIVWDGADHRSVTDAMVQSEQDDDTLTNVASCAEWLRDLLDSDEDHPGWMEKADIDLAAKDAKFNDRLLRRARKRAGLTTIRRAVVRGPSVWFDPERWQYDRDSDTFTPVAP